MGVRDGADRPSDELSFIQPIGVEARYYGACEFDHFRAFRSDGDECGRERTGADNDSRVRPVPNPSEFGRYVELQVDVTPKVGTGSPSGTVTFYDNQSTPLLGKRRTAIGSAAVGPFGIASMQTNRLMPGDHFIDAVYSGDSGDARSTSNTVEERVVCAPEFNEPAPPVCAPATVPIPAPISVEGPLGSLVDLLFGLAFRLGL